MPKKIRIRTEVGVDKSVQVDLNQDFELLEILSLQFTQQELYTRMCSDYGVIVGRVTVNNGYGVPNAKVSIFIPLEREDEDDPVISTLYPYKSLSDRNEDGYKYNLLPYIPSYSNHTPTGTFPTRRDVLVDRSVIEVYEKYYKFTVTTNRSGDFMIFGVPVGSQKLIMNVDISDIGEFSQTPQDLIRIGRATEAQVNGTKFKSSTNFEELPQIITLQREVQVFPLWGDEELCQNAISRADFDLTAEADLTIQPTSVFMGSMISTIDIHAVKRKCKVKNKMGNLCSLQAGPGEILAIRQTIFYDANGYPILEQAQDLERKGKVIDENGAWLMEIPMNLDYVTTNEFGEQVISIDPKVGIPTKGKYRFKIKWEQPQNLSDPVKRAYFLIPNIKEWGWTNSTTDPTDTAPSPSFSDVNRSYAFSVDWNDYGVTGTTNGDEMIRQAINCEDRFYEFQYNKVYTVSQLIDQYRAGLQARRIISVKNILDDTCESTNNPFPTNDAVYQPDLLYLLFSFLIAILIPIVLFIVFILHVIAWIINLLYKIVKKINKLGRKVGFGNLIDEGPFEDALQSLQLRLNIITYPDCEICECNIGTTTLQVEDDEQNPATNTSYTILANTVDGTSFTNCVSPLLSLPNPEKDDNLNLFQNLIAGNNPFNGGGIRTYCPDQTTTSTSSLSSLNLTGSGTSYSNGLFSNNLTFSERLNLFNTKMKYFDVENFGIAPNQMKVTFQYDLNNPTTTFHHDNVIVMITDEIGLQTFTAGKLISFQDPENKKDINTWRANPLDTEFQVTCITGTPINAGVTSQVISYANPINPSSPNVSTTYSIKQGTDDAILHKFPIDIEYFQVITGMSISTYSGICNPSYATQFPQSLPARFLFNNVSFREVSNKPYTINLPYSTSQPSYIGPGSIRNGIIGNYGTNNYIDGNDINPLTCFANYSALTVVFLVRGVDPNTTRVPCSYDLSRLFGYTNYNATPNVIFTGNYKLNIPIQAGKRIPRHDKINLNGPINSFGGLSANWRDYQYLNNLPIGPQTIFYPSYHFELGSQFSSFTSNTIAYYSALDETSMGNLANNGEFYDIPSFQPYSLGSGLPSIFGFNPGTFGAEGIRTPSTSNTTFNWFTTDYKPSNVFFSYMYSTNYVTSTIPSSPPSPNSNTLILFNNVLDFYVDPTMWPTYTITASTNTTNFDNRGYYLNESLEGGTMMSCEIVPGLTSSPVPVTPPTSSYISTGGRSLTSANLLGTTEWNAAQITAALSGTTLKYNNWQPIRQFKFAYFSPVYPENTTYCTYQDYQRIVMRSDRLPTSDVLSVDRLYDINGPQETANVFVFQQNPSFAIYTITDDGVVASPVNVSPGGGSQEGSDTESTGSAAINSVLNSLNSCEDSYPLGCYASVGQTISIKQSCINGDTRDYYQNGCYIFVRDPYIKSFFKDTNGNPSDIKLVMEWATRFKINFALCRNVFGHMFTNNWINGTLFAYSFKNDRFFTGPLDNPPNSPYNRFCTDTIILQEPTKNFYYRSSPFRYTAGQFGEFIGLKNERRTLGIPHTLNSNVVNLLNPTTIVDLGPRNVFMQEYILNDNYDGYYMDKFNSTTFGEVDDILNFFVISRLANGTFLGALLGAINANSAGSILSYFSRIPRTTLFPSQKNMVDGDYAQMISINSELGVAPFDSANYPDVPAGSGDNPMFYNGSNATDGIIGIFFSSDTQLRDYVTPRRVILRPGDPIPPGPLDQDFYYIPVTTQYVPFYSWTKKVGNPDYIFGSQRNDWATNIGYNTGFFVNKLQNMDRIQFLSPLSKWAGATPISDYFMTKDQSKNTFFKGYVYGQKDIGPPANDVYTALVGDVNVNTSNNGASSVIYYRVGAPFHFYFGLVKGGTAIDLFRTKYIEKDFNDE